MSVHESVALFTVQVLFLGTWIVIGTCTLWLLYLFRTRPKQVLQLRLFNMFQDLRGALVSLGAGMFAGMFAPAPLLFGIDPPLYWLVAWTAAWSVMVTHGFRTLIGIFRAPMSRGIPA